MINERNQYDDLPVRERGTESLLNTLNIPNSLKETTNRYENPFYDATSKRQKNTYIDPFSEATTPDETINQNGHNRAFDDIIRKG